MARRRSGLVGLLVVLLLGLAALFTMRAINSGCDLPPLPPESPAVSRVQLGVEVLNIAAGPAGLWAVYRPDATRVQLIELDPVTGKIKGRPVDLQSHTRSLAVGNGAVWVMTSRRTARPKGVLNKVDSKKHRIVAQLPVGSGSSILAAGYETVWLGNGKSNSVLQIDPKGPRIIRRVRVAESPWGLIARAGAAWVRTGTEAIYRIDASTGRTETLPERGILENVGAGGVWITGNGPPNGQLRMFDPVTLRRVGPTLRLNHLPASIGIAGDQLWLGKLYTYCPPNLPRDYRGLAPISMGWSRLDPRTLKALSGPVHLGEGGRLPAYASGAFWFLPGIGNELIRLDLTAAAKVRP